MLSPCTDDADDQNSATSPSEDEIMTRDELIADVGAQLDAVDCAGFFSVYVPTKTQVNPGLEVKGLGKFGTPLYDRDIQLLKQKVRQAPLGKGEETIVDTAVRNTWEIDASEIGLTHPDWKRQEQSILETVCTNLGVNGGSSNVRAELYKLLIYEEGAHFKQHRDSEKANGMFATMVICLPSAHQGGDVVVTFGKETKTFSTARNAEWFCTYLAWYADVLHEVRPVQNGARVVLTYNLLYRGQEAPPNPLKLEEDKIELKRTLKRWRDQLDNGDLPDYLAYPFEHEYSEANLKLAHLKRQDKARAVCAAQIADELGLHCFLALISKTVIRQEWEEEEGVEDDEDMDCKVLDFNGRVLLNDFSLPQDVLATDEPWAKGADEEEEGGWTGNEGAETTYWYKDCALLLVPKSKWIDVQLDAHHSFEGKKQVIRAQFDSMRPGDLDDEKTTIAEHLLGRFLRADPTTLSSSWGPAPQHEAFSFELLQKCVQLGLVPRLAVALRYADQRMSSVIIRHAQVLLPQLGFNAIAPCLEAAVQQSVDIHARAELIWRIEETMGGQPDERFTQWRDRQVAKSLTMPLGGIARAVPILVEMAVRSQATYWAQDELVPALSGKTKDAKILFHFASDLLSRAHSEQFPVEKAVEMYSRLLLTITQGIVLPTEAPRQNYWRNTVSDNAGPFESGDLTRLLGDILRMHRMQLIPDATPHISRLHEKVIDLATSTIMPNIHSIVIPYIRTSAQLMSSHGVPASDPAFQHLFTSLIHQVVYRYVGHEPQPGSLARGVRGCRRCAECNQLDAILESARERGGSVFVRLKKDINHLTSQFSRKHNRYSYSNRPDNITITTQTQTVPYCFQIAKVDRKYGGDFKRWEGRFNEIQGLLSSIAPEDTLRQLVGQRYDELVRLHGTILVRTPEGTILTPPMYLHQRPPTQAPPVDNGTASSNATAAGPPTAGTLKRKGSDQDQENREPRKRIGIVDVIDLSESP